MTDQGDSTVFVKLALIRRGVNAFENFANFSVTSLSFQANSCPQLSSSQLIARTWQSGFPTPDGDISVSVIDLYGEMIGFGIALD